MANSLMTLLVFQDGLTWRRLWEGIPTDPAAVFVYLLLAIAVGWVVWGSRKKGKPSA